MSHAHRWWLAAIVAVYLLLGVATSLVVPLGEAPDELDHFRFVQTLLATRRLPVMSPVAAENVTMEANQPPLYYAGAALAAAPAGPSALLELPFNPCFALDPADPGRAQFYLHTLAEGWPFTGAALAFHLARLWSLLCGAGAVLLACLLGRQLWPADGRVGLLAAALLAFNPQFLFITASVNNDALTALLGAAIVALAVVVGKEVRPGRVLALGVLLGLGALTKLALFALWPVALLAVVWPAWRATGAVRWPGRVGALARRALPNLLRVGLPPLLLAGWWFWRNRQLYGDPLAWAVHLAAKGASVVREGAFSGRDLAEFASFHFQSYWAWFGWLNIKAPGWVYGLLLALLLAGAAGLLLLVWDRREPGRVGPVGLALALNGLAVAGVYLSLLRYVQTINWSGYQGRLAYAAAGPLAALLALGLWRLGGRWAAGLAGGGLGLLAMELLVGILGPAYPRPVVYQPLQVHEAACARLGEWQVVGYSVAAEVVPGRVLPVTLFGYGLRDGTGRVGLDLVGREGVVVGEAQAALSWQAGQVFSATLALPVAAEALPAQGLLRVVGLDPAGEWLPVTHPAGRPVETPFPLAVVGIVPAAVPLVTPNGLRIAP